MNTVTENSIRLTLSCDMMTSTEKRDYDDEQEDVSVRKRDPESAHAVKVGTMDYFVPEKLPQPRYVLESLVWDREKEVDRLRERFQLSRALMQAKTASQKMPKRSALQRVREQQSEKRKQQINSGSSSNKGCSDRISNNIIYNIITYTYFNINHFNNIYNNNYHVIIL
jgi:hypothetical protein